jgi:hypothetical protein
MIGRLQALSAALDRAVIAACIACFLIMLAISFVGFFYQVITGAASTWPWRFWSGSCRSASRPSSATPTS